MKRLALVLAASVLGTGCYVSSSYGPPSTLVGSVNLYWDFDRNAPAQAGGFITYDAYPGGSTNGRCTQSAVDFVTVDAPGVPQISVPCVYMNVQGVGVDGVPAGTQPFLVRAWRHVPSIGDVVVYQQTFNLDVPVNAVQSYPVHVGGVSAVVDVVTYLAYGATPTDYATCVAATPVGSSFPPNLSVEIRDVFNTLIDHGTAGCPAAGTLPTLVFSNPLDLDDFNVRVQGRQVENGALVFDSCSVSLTHFGTQTGAGAFFPTALTNPVPTCP